ncbi:AtpZ/AtpI family protein [Daeguia caeni]|uniref:ATP synthase protein I n=1 Tax=Daeguia caeni TaxID=439612 RepID=A0ABV9H900_9HYPH
MARGAEPGKPSGAVKDAGGKPNSGELEQRLSRLEVELTRKGALRQPVPEGERSERSGSVAQAMKLSSEFIAGVVVGGVIGWSLDRFAGTSPWGMIVFLLLGFAAGTLNVLRAAGYVAESGNIKSATKEDEKN